MLPDFSISFLQAIGSNWSMGVVSFLIVLAVVKIYKVDEDMDSREYFQRELQALGSMQRKEKSSLFVLAALLLISSVTGIDSMMVLSIVPYLMFLPFINAASVDSLKNVPFGMIFVGAFCIAIGALSTTLGFGQLISEMFVP